MTSRNSPYRDHPLRAYTVEEAADILSCEPGWLEELAQQRKVPYTELSGACHFTSTHLAAITSAFEVLPPAGEPSQAVASPAPAELAHTADQAAAIIGGTCTAYWLKVQARRKKIPYTQIGRACNFTDAQIREIIGLREVLPRQSAKLAPSPGRVRIAPGAANVPPPLPRERRQLQARTPPRKRGKAEAT